VRLEFDENLYVQEFAKTQFAGVDWHLKVVGLLKAIQSYFRELRVADEGEFCAKMKVKEPDGKTIDLITEASTLPVTRLPGSKREVPVLKTKQLQTLLS